MFNALGARDIESGALLAVASGRQSAAKWPAEIACTLNARYGDKQGLEDQHALGGASLFVPAVGTDCFNARQDPVQYGDQAGALDQDGYTMAVAQPSVTHTLRGRGFNASEDGTGRGTPLVSQTSGMQVRRLTPVECERLQGFPDGYTDIRPRGKDTPDGPRYKALGNSMAVPVMRWIGERVNLVDSLKRSR
jgi:DNA (cytosine-5)-methyltransferase 1